MECHLGQLDAGGHFGGWNSMNEPQDLCKTQLGSVKIHSSPIKGAGEL